MDARIKRQRTLDAIKRIILRDSLRQPVVVIFEDLHWIDEQTQGLLDLLADSVASARMLLLCNYRPEYHHGWANKSYYAQLRLDPLAGADGAAMLSALLGEGDELSPLKRLIAERTGGNPFFIEEIVQGLFQDGALVRNGTVKVTRSLSQLQLPPTVQGMLAARIDRLLAAYKELLQTLAVIGREVPVALVKRVVAADEVGLSQGLAELRAGEFVYEQPVAGDTEYVFKHALTQEVAYNSLLIERRKQIHEHGGHALESIFAGQLDDHLTQLAHHYSHSDNADKAIEYLGRAGQQAMQRSAHTDAVASLSGAIDLLQRRPESPERDQRELLLQLALGVAIGVVHGWASLGTERAFSRTRELCTHLGDPPELFSVLFGLWGMHFIRAEFRRAYELARQLLTLAEDANDPGSLLYAQFALGETSVHLGELLQGKLHLEMVISLYDRERHHPLVFRFTGVDAGVTCRSYAAQVLWTLGYPDQALKQDDEAVALAQALSDPQSLAAAKCFAGILCQKVRGRARVAQEIQEAVIALSTQHGLANWLSPATIMRGWSMAEQGRHNEGIALMQEGPAALQATGRGNRSAVLSLPARGSLRRNQ